MNQNYNKDYYLILGINSSATQDDIRRAYIKLSKIHHPDMGGSILKMQEINEAYEVLSDLKSRQRYDYFYFQNKRTNTNKNEQDYETHTQSKSKRIVTLHILDYTTGYIKQKKPIDFFNSNVQNMVYFENIYSYVSDINEKKITVISAENFYMMLKLYSAKDIQCKIVNRHKKPYVATININEINNNFREFILPGKDYICVKKVKQGYDAVSFDEYNCLLKRNEKERKNNIISKIFAIMLVIIIISAYIFYNYESNNYNDYTYSDNYSYDNEDDNYNNEQNEPVIPSRIPPEHNTVMAYEDYPHTNLTIKTTSSKGSKYYYIKICRPDSTTPVQTVFIHAGQTAYAYVPTGNYNIKWVCGDIWYGEDYLFLNKSAQMADDTFTFVQTSSWELTLYPVKDGNLETEIIDMEDF